MDSLIDKDTRIKVSSTLDKSVGKKFLTDGSPESCWSSQQGLPQSIHLIFASAVIPKTISITFQGGFVGTCCAVDVLPNGTAAKAPEAAQMYTLVHVYPEDVNRRQSFDLPESTSAVDQIKITFKESSDFFGRVTVYDLQIRGTHL